MSRADAKARMLAWGEESQLAFAAASSQVGGIAARGALGVGAVFVIARLLRGRRRAKKPGAEDSHARTHSGLHTLAMLVAERVVEHAVRAAAQRMTKAPGA